MRSGRRAEVAKMARKGKKEVKETCVKTGAMASTSTERLDSADQSVKRRWLGMRDTDAQVERALKDPHFKHIPDVTLSNKHVNGKTIRETVTDILHGLKSNQRASTSTHSGLTERFSEGPAAHTSTVDQLKLENDAEPLDHELIKHLMALQGESGHVKATKSLKAYL